MMNAMDAREWVELFIKEQVEANLMSVEATIYDCAVAGHSSCAYKLMVASADEDSAEEIRKEVVTKLVDNGYGVGLAGPIGEEDGFIINIHW